MASNDLAFGDDWIKVRREQGAAKFSPVVTIRSKGTLALSADFVRMADIESRPIVSLFLSLDGRRLAFKFHNNESDVDAYRVVSDGGSGQRKPGKSRLIVASALFKQSPTLAALQRDRDVNRRFEPTKIGTDRWTITLMPCFELVWGAADVAGDQTGIYRYRSGPETVYIGRGNLKQRMFEPERQGWQFDKIEYSVLNEDTSERRWEGYWLDEYRRRWNRWPVYNRIAGIVAKTG